MTNKEKVVYTENCLKLLGYKCVTPDNKNFKIYVGESNNIPNSVDANLSEEFLKNWNWIVEICEAIEKLDNLDSKYASNYNVVIDCFGCTIETTGYVNKIVVTVDNYNKKEAVVEAVNNFLIWYETTNNH